MLGLPLVVATQGLAVAGELNQLPPGVGVLWAWQETQTSDGTTVVPDDPTRYTIALLPDRRVAIEADCNRGAGAYTLAGNGITIGPIAVTQAACAPGSLGDAFLTQLGAAATYSVEGPYLVIDLADDSGTMRFAAPAMNSGE